MRNLIYLTLLFSLVSCDFFSQEKPYREQKDSLSLDYAQKRKQNISHVRYQLKFDLTEKDNFQGTTAIQFNLKEPMDLSVDFSGGEVQELLVNGKKVSSIAYNGFFIDIPKKYQQIGLNSILVEYTHDYSKNAVGFYKFVDKADNRTYLYSHFEPYSANKMFPCFDQPNLKATYTSIVMAPKGWQVISSTRESEKIEKGDFEEWYFPTSETFSTYTYSLHAGEYAVWEDVAKTKKQEIPLRLFARQSLASFVKTQDWFDWTKQGFSFFEKYFSYAYPYHKYDQLIVPDFNHGAMENVAAVTYNEDRYVSKGEKTRGQRRRLASTLLHEMAHMWFGNLVTMDWWDDVWLNESFATHSSYEALVDATEFKEGWKVFNAFGKQHAYRQDQSINTHPVAQSCLNTSEAFSNFDAITYGKGASVLRQLSYFLGDKTYKKALKSYFATYETSNTKLSDFMNEMEKASGKDLKVWQNRWLKKAMVNNLEVHFTCHRGRVDNFELFQTATREYPTLRTHKTKIALFRKSHGGYRLNRSLRVEYSGERTQVKKLIGALCPDIVYPNYEDHDYVSVILDHKSLKNIEAGLGTLHDDFLRSVLWSDLWMMVLNQKLNMAKFLEIAEFNGLAEKDLDIVVEVFSHVIEILKHYYPDSGQPWVARRQVWIKFFEQAFITKIHEYSSDEKIQKIWFKNLVALAESPDVLKQLRLTLNTRSSGLPLAFEINQDLRWSVVNSLAINDYQKVADIIKQESKKDRSKRGQLNALSAQALMPHLEAKKGFFKDIMTKQATESFGVLRTIMYSLFPSQQKALHRKFSEDFYASLKKVLKTSDPYYSTTFVRSMVPAFCDQKSSTQISNYLAAEKNLPFPVVKSLKSALFENQRCYEMRRLLKNEDQKQDNEYL